ncbi:putative MFS transporter [Aeropyrum pernix K1]|uniref:MFS transporter n=1 Tax=Aeropyrum pernix (strain ATCC 700893 / DSM 11879 / JCM 9820 / NBRC 100138 / K1) TaxID=272557 RepID=Q9YEA2_AERPE|nr:MFS transporter [Aeropyrum pernix]BAA79644.1 putative MFS transporter [Aeropyrum pernix K1]
MDRGGVLRVAAAALPAYAYFYNVGSIGFWLPLHVRELGWPYTYITLIATWYFVAVTLATPLVGLLSDLTRRPGYILAGGMAVVAATSVAIPHVENPPLLMALRALQGLGLAVGLPIALGSLSLIQGVRRGVASTVIASGLGMSGGAFLSGLMVEYLGFPALFYAAAVPAALSTLVALGWRPPPPPSGSPGLLAALRSMPWEVLVVMAGIAVRNTFASGVFSVVSIIFNKIVGISYTATGVVLAINPAVQASVTTVFERIMRGRALLLYSTGLSGTALAFYLYLTAGSALDLAAAQIALGAFYGATVVSGNTMIIALAPSEIRYTASSLYTFAFNIGWILGTSIAGKVMDAAGVDAWIKLAIAGTLVSGLIPLTLLASPRARRI